MLDLANIWKTESKSFKLRLEKSCIFKLGSLLGHPSNYTIYKSSVSVIDDGKEFQAYFIEMNASDLPDDFCYDLTAILPKISSNDIVIINFTAKNNQSIKLPEKADCYTISQPTSVTINRACKTLDEKTFRSYEVKRKERAFKDDEDQKERDRKKLKEEEKEETKIDNTNQQVRDEMDVEKPKFIYELAAQFSDRCQTEGISNKLIGEFFEEAKHFLHVEQIYSGSALSMLLITLTNKIENDGKENFVQINKKLEFILPHLIQFYFDNIDKEIIKNNEILLGGSEKKYLVSFFYRLGVLIFKSNFKFERKDQILKILERILHLQNPDLQNITNTLYTLGRLSTTANDDKFLKDDRSLNQDKSLLAYVKVEHLKTLLDLFFNSNDIAPPSEIFLMLKTFSYFMVNGIDKLNIITDDQVRKLLDIFLKQESVSSALAKTISGIIWELGIFAEYKPMLLSKLTDEDIYQLITVFLTNEPNNRDLSNVTWTLSKLMEMSDKLIDGIPPVVGKVTSEQIAEMTKKIAVEKEEKEPINVSQFLTGLGKFAEIAPHLLDDVSANDIKKLMDNLLDPSLEPTAKSLCSALFALGRFAEYKPQLLASINQDHIQKLIQASYKQKSTFQRIEVYYIILSIGRIAENNPYLLSKLKIADIKLIIEESLNLKIKKNETLSRYAATALQTLGRLALNAPYLLDDSLKPAIFKLVEILRDPLIQPNTLDLSMSIVALGRLAENKQSLLSDMQPAHIERLVNAIFDSKEINDRYLSSAMVAIGRFAEKMPHLLSTLTASTFQRLIDKLVNLKDDNQKISNIFMTFSRMTRVPHLFVGIKANVVRDLFYQKKEFTEGGLDYFQTISGLSTLFNLKEWKDEAKQLEKDDEFKLALTKYIQSFFDFSLRKQKKIGSRTSYFSISNGIALLAKSQFINIDFIVDDFYKFINFLANKKLTFILFENLIKSVDVIIDHKQLTESKRNDLLALLQKQLSSYPLELKLVLLEQINSPTLKAYLKIDPEEHKKETVISPDEIVASEQTETLPQYSMKSVGTVPDMTAAIKKIRPPRMYDLGKKEDIEKLEQECKCTFIKDKNSSKFFVADVYIIKQLGLYTKNVMREDLDHTIGKYEGEHVDEEPVEEESGKKSLYNFELRDEKTGEIFGFVKGDETRNQTAFINFSSSCPNTLVKLKKVRTKTGMQHQIYFYASTDMNGQVLFDYQKQYFLELGFKPFFIHPSDNWKSPEEIYQENQKFYFNEKVIFDEKTKKELQLGDKSEWIIPTIFMDIYKNDHESLARNLASGTPIDLLAYACHQEGMVGYDFEVREKYQAHQQHLTGLMFACYLGYEACIQLLLDKEADSARPMLITGYYPLTLLLMGQGEQEVVERVGQILLDKMPGYPFAKDANDLTILHYAIVRNSQKLVDKMLFILANEPLEINLNNIMFNENHSHADFDYCILHGQLAVLDIMLSYVVNHPHLLGEGGLNKKIEEGFIFKVETFSQASLQHLQTLKELLQNKYPQLLSNIPKLDEFIELKKKKVTSSQKPIFLYDPGVMIANSNLTHFSHPLSSQKPETNRQEISRLLFDIAQTCQEKFKLQQSIPPVLELIQGFYEKALALHNTSEIQNALTNFQNMYHSELQNDHSKQFSEKRIINYKNSIRGGDVNQFFQHAISKVNSIFTRPEDVNLKNTLNKIIEDKKKAHQNKSKQTKTF